MPYKDKPVEKMYYPISEVAKMFDVSASLLRYWEKEFTVLKPRKNKRGTRYFTQKDIENLKLIYSLLKEKGYTIEGAKKKLRADSRKTIETHEIKYALLRVRGFLKRLKEEL